MTKNEIKGYRSLGFSQWARHELKDSQNGLIWTDIDGFFMDYFKKRCLILEYKVNTENIPFAQKQQLKLLDMALGMSCPKFEYDYWGVFILNMIGADNPSECKALTLNGISIGYLTLVEHLSFDKKFTEGLFNHAQRT